MTSKRKKYGIIFLVLLIFLALIDGVRYLKPDADNKIDVKPYNTFSAGEATKIILVYNANGGIYPGIVDFINKEFFPSSYPCNLCYLTFGTFSMKQEWKQFIAGLPYEKVELHKDTFKRLYTPETFTLPCILIGNANATQVLLSAEELNTATSLPQIMNMVNAKLNR